MPFEYAAGCDTGTSNYNALRAPLAAPCCTDAARDVPTKLMIRVAFHDDLAPSGHELPPHDRRRTTLRSVRLSNRQLPAHQISRSGSLLCLRGAHWAVRRVITWTGLRWRRCVMRFNRCGMTAWTGRISISDGEPHTFPQHSPYDVKSVGFFSHHPNRYGVSRGVCWSKSHTYGGIYANIWLALKLKREVRNLARISYWHIDIRNAALFVSTAQGARTKI